MVKNLEISECFIKQIEKYKGEHKVIDDLIKIPGMNFMMPLLHHISKGCEGLQNETILGIEQALLQEFIESQTKIKSVIFNHMIVRMKKDPLFKARVINFDHIFF